MMVLAGNFPDADSTEVSSVIRPSNVGTTSDALYQEDAADCQGDLSCRRQSLRLDRRIGIQLRYLLRRQYAGPTNTYTYKPQGLLQRMAVNANGSAGTKRRHDYDAVRSDLRQL